NEDSEILPFDATRLPDASVQLYPTETPMQLGPWLLLFALSLLILDALAVLWIADSLRLWRRGLATGLVLILALPGLPRADEASDRAAVEAVSSTHLAYVVTGNEEIDSTSRAGLYGLSVVLAERTALEPGDPVGINPARDELAFY